MRFNFTSLSRPKQLAKDLHQLLPSAKLSDTQLMAARLYGYVDWHELEQVTLSPASPPSAWDEDVHAEERRRRFDYQQKRLAELVGHRYKGGTPGILYAVTPTSSTGLARKRIALCSSRGNPWLALAQQELFCAADGVLSNSYATFWHQQNLDGHGPFSEEGLARVPGLPPGAHAALTSAQRWSESQIVAEPTSILQTCVFRTIELQPDGQFGAAAVWRFEFRAFKDPAKLPEASFTLDHCWVAPYRVGPSSSELGGQAAYVWYRMAWALWKPFDPKEEAEELAFEEELGRLFAGGNPLGKALQRANDRPVWKGPPAITISVPDQPQARAAVGHTLETFNYVLGQRFGGRRYQGLLFKIGEHSTIDFRKFRVPGVTTAIYSPE